MARRFVGGLARALVYYPIRPVPSLALLAGDGGSLLPRWAAMAAQRRVIGLASVDAHARLGREGGFNRAWVSLRAPGYETLFATAQVSVELDAALSGDADRDAAAVLRALRGGRTFSTIAARAAAGRVAIVAERGGVRARMGEFLPGAGPVVVTVEADAPREAVIRIACDGRTITQTVASTTFSRALDPGEAGHACQAVVGWPGPAPDRFVTWAVTNPIYLRAADPPPAAAPVAATRDAIGTARRGSGRVARRARGQRRGASRAGRPADGPRTTRRLSAWPTRWRRARAPASTRRW